MLVSLCLARSLEFGEDLGWKKLWEQAHRHDTGILDTGRNYLFDKGGLQVSRGGEEKRQIQKEEEIDAGTKAGRKPREQVLDAQL